MSNIWQKFAKWIYGTLYVLNFLIKEMYNGFGFIKRIGDWYNGARLV